MGLATLGGPVSFAGVASAGNTVSGCTTIDSPGSYQLDSDVVDTAQTGCIEIRASDVTFDGQGHTIEGTNVTDSRSIDISATGTISNVTVRDVTIRDWDTGVYSEAADTAINDSTFDRILVGTGSEMFHFDAADGSVVADNTFGNPPGSFGQVGGVYDSPDFSFVRNDVADVKNGLFVGGANTLISDNTFDLSKVKLGPGDGGLVANNSFVWDGTGTSIEVDRSDDLVVRDNDIDDTYDGVEIDNAVGVTVERNEITGVEFAIEAANLNGPVDDTAILNNDIDDSGETAISLEDGPGSTIAGNTADDGGGIGINVTRSGSATVRDNAVRNNALSGVRVEQSDDASLLNNTVLGNNRDGSSTAAGVRVTDTADVTVSEQVVRNNARAGLRIRDADRIEVRDSRITENCGGQFGVSLADSADALFVGNNVSNNTGVGMQVFDVSPNLTVRDSKFDDNGEFGFQDEPGTTFENVSANGNDKEGISASTDTVLRDVTAWNNTDEGLRLDDNVTIHGGSVGGNGAMYEILAPGEFTATDLTVGSAHLDAVDARAVDIDGPDPVFPTRSTPEDREYVGTNVSVSTNSGGYVDVEVSYSDTELSSFDESTLALWRDTGRTWSEFDGSLDESTTTVSGNTTSGGTLVVLAAGNDPPSADFAAPSSTTVGETVPFDASGAADPDGSIAAYEWDFGDGATGTGVDPSHTYDSSGDYTVELTVTDDAGATATTSETITVASETSGGGGGSDVSVGGWTDLSSKFAVDAAIPERPIEAGDTLSVAATVRNTGELGGEFDVELFLDGDAAGVNRTVELDSREETEVTLEYDLSAVGEYDVGVSGTRVGTVTVREAGDQSGRTPNQGPTATTTGDPTETAQETDPTTADPTASETAEPTVTGTDETTDESGPGFGVLAGVVATLAVARYLRRR